MLKEENQCFYKYLLFNKLIIKKNEESIFDACSRCCNDIRFLR